MPNRKQAAEGAPKRATSKIYWPSQAFKTQVQDDAQEFHKSESGYVTLCVGAARNPVLFAELAGLYGTRLALPLNSGAQASDSRVRELEAELRRVDDLREAAEARAADLQTRLEESEAEKKTLLTRYRTEADLRASPVARLVHGELAGPVEAPPVEAVRAIDAITSRLGAPEWASEGAILTHMREKEGVPDQATALVILRTAKRLDLAVNKAGRWALTANGRALTGG